MSAKAHPQPIDSVGWISAAHPPPPLVDALRLSTLPYCSIPNLENKEPTA